MCWMVPARPSGAAPLLVLSCSGAFCSATAMLCVKPFATVTALMLQLSRATRQESAGTQCEDMNQTVKWRGKETGQGDGKGREGKGREGKGREGSTGQEEVLHSVACKGDLCTVAGPNCVQVYQRLALHCNTTT